MTKHEALRAHELDGGYLLDLGPETETIINRRTGEVVGERHLGRHSYVVTNEPQEYGRTAEQIAEMDRNGWSEIKG
jgi:hypothetical protein